MMIQGLTLSMGSSCNTSTIENQGLLPRLAQGIVRPKVTTLSEVYSYTLNINRIFIKLFFFHLKSIVLEKKKLQVKTNPSHY